jgi:hypothetical protein
MMAIETDLMEARKLAWHCARLAFEYERGLDPQNATYNSILANTLRDLCDEVEILRGPHVVFLPNRMGP